jgi:hypothetical protein
MIFEGKWPRRKGATDELQRTGATPRAPAASHESEIGKWWTLIFQPGVAAGRHLSIVTSGMPPRRGDQRQRAATK